jgi:predicted N-acetyltransferase YhbS
MLTHEDWLAVRSLISHTCGEGPPGIGWDVRRWDGKRYHRTDHEQFLEVWSERVRLWWDGPDLVGAAHPEGPGEAHFQVRPGYRHLQAEMLDWAIDHLPHESRLAVFCMDHDTHLRGLLDERGFGDAGWGGVSRFLTFGPEPPPDPETAGGYEIRTTSPDDADGIAGLLNTAFRRDFHVGGELTEFWSHARSHVPEMDLVAEADDGTLAAYVGVCWDEPIRFGVFEPVCTHPDHLRRGLARSLMQRGLVLLHGREARSVMVETGDQAAANALYDGIGFTETYRGRGFTKQTG